MANDLLRWKANYSKVRKYADIFFQPQIFDLHSVDTVKSDEIPASTLELAHQKRTSSSSSFPRSTTRSPIFSSMTRFPSTEQLAAAIPAYDRLSQILAGFLGLCGKEHRRAALLDGICSYLANSLRASDRRARYRPAGGFTASSGVGSTTHWFGVQARGRPFRTTDVYAGVSREPEGRPLYLPRTIRQADRGSQKY